MELSKRRERLIIAVKEGYAMRQFIKEDLKRSLSQKKKVTETETAQINILLADAEQNAKMREGIGPLDPHRNITHGSKLKIFVKKMVCKLSWWMVRPVVDSQNYYNVLNNSISNAVRDSVCLLKDIVDMQQSEINELKQKLVDLNAEYVELKQCMEPSVAEEESVYDYIDYVDFEKTFRGTQQEVCNRIKRYLTYFKEGDIVVDLGCGRGEWLGLLEANGIKATGVDMNASFIKICRDKGLNVEERDFFEYLEEIPDASLDGITAIQVIEHITPIELARLVKLCYKKVKFGGHVIFETQNPTSVSTMTGGFFIDPTHERPVHPLWIKYLMEKVSFMNIILEYPEYAWVTAGSIPQLEGMGDNVSAFNYKISYLNNLLYGSTDYAIIAEK